MPVSDDNPLRNENARRIKGLLILLGHVSTLSVSIDLLPVN